MNGLARALDDLELSSSQGASSAETNLFRLSSPDTTGTTTPIPAKDRIVVGVDFGTTYSGVGIACSSAPDDIEIIKSWPGGNGITSDKVPTEIGYVDTPSSAGNGSGQKAVKWGFQFKPEEPRLRCIKLFLDHNQKLPHFVSPLDTAVQLRQHGKTVHDAVADYLSAVYKHTMETLVKRNGQTFISNAKIEFILTVPAVWSDAAKNATLQAAEQAGMGSKHELMLISEPEAAAVYTLKAIQPQHLKVNDNFVVCDAGGGTVDLIAYRLTSLSPLRMEESVVGTGGLCGSAFLNYGFQDYVKVRLGEAAYNEMREKKPKTWNMALKHFEEFVKRNFNDDDDQDEIHVPFPGLPDNEAAGIDCGFLLMRADQVKAILDPVVKQVITLVESQVDTVRDSGGHVAGILLVGGFGQSNYMHKRLKAHFNAPPPPYSEIPGAGPVDLPDAIEVMHPMHAWTAVVRGAVLRGLEGNVVSTRRSRWHYGTSYATVFDESIHPLKDRYWSPLWERWMVSDRMQWHISKGASVSELDSISFQYTRNFRAGQSLLVEDELLACDNDEAPDAYHKHLIHVCTLKTDLSCVPQALFSHSRTTKGTEFSNLDFSLDMRIQSAGLVFELRVDGVRYGMVEAEFH